MLFNFKKKDYFEAIDGVGIFDNDKNTMLPQTVCAKIIREHFKTAKKTPKVLFMGFDGARADSMAYVVKSREDKTSGKLFLPEYSAIKLLKSQGELVLTYAGGEPETPQETSTAQGWSAILTGEWGGKNGVLKHVPINTDCPTVLRELAENGKKSAFLAEWEDHFTITYKEEMRIAEENKIPLVFKRHKTDEELEQSFIEYIKGDTDCIFGIFEAPDYNGHTFGFGDQDYRYVTAVNNLDRVAYKLIDEVTKRPAYNDEDWLIMITSDHGGHGYGHGTQKTEDRNTFLACNKKITK